jgi:hypothetical protein
MLAIVCNASVSCKGVAIIFCWGGPDFKPQILQMYLVFNVFYFYSGVGQKDTGVGRAHRPPPLCYALGAMPKKAELDSECLLTNFLSGVLSLQTEKLPGDLQDVEHLFVIGFQFREEFLELKCDLLVGGQDRAYSFPNARNREDAVQRL